MILRDERVEGVAMHDAIAKTLSKGALRWSPVASGAHGISVHALDMGIRSRHQQASRTRQLVTIWKKQAEGTWKVTFDIGRTGY